MTDSQYTEMISMLTQATKNRKLTWNWDETSGDYYCTLGSCGVRLSSSINFQMQSENVSLQLYNMNNVQFDSISGDSLIDTNRYTELNELYQKVHDSYFRVSESEKIIMDKLHELTAKPVTPNPVQPEDDLPF